MRDDVLRFVRDDAPRAMRATDHGAQCAFARSAR
jgi:hypothetical protein